KVPELQRLERTFIFKRTGQAGLTVRDEVAFSEPRSFEEALITWGRWKALSDSELLITDGQGAVRVKIDTGGHPFNISAETLDEDVPPSTQPLRLAITLRQPVAQATITLTALPAISSHPPRL